MRLSFKAHYYEIKPKSQHVNIKTDNNPYLGEKPYLVYKRSDRNKAYELPMEKNGEFFEAGFYFSGSTDSVKYHIDYKDTNKTDIKNNDDYAVDLEKLTQSACAYNRIRHKQPLINPLKRGTAQGRVIFKDNFTYAQITAGSDFLKIDEIENFQNEKTKEIQKIVIPKMRYVNKILISDEYEKDTVGAKAYNLKRLETLVKQGKIDVNIPLSVAVPHAFIEEKLNDPENFYEPMKELISLMEKEGINTKKVMVRSAFNGENVRIELKESPYFHKTVSPYVFIYNKNTGELKQESIQEVQPTVTYDEDFKIIDESPVYDPIRENYEKYEKLLKKLVKNALIIENEFGATQDIEGGLLDGDIYLWQTRNIVD